MAQLAANLDTKMDDKQDPTPKPRKSIRMPNLSTTYLLPAILLNPAFVLHLINTFISHLTTPLRAIASTSPHPFMASLGPNPDAAPHFDVHADDALCWRYTAFMVVVQLLAFGRVQDNRVQRRERRAERKEKLEKERIIKMERERARKEKLDQETEQKPHAVGHQASGVTANGCARDSTIETLFDGENVKPADSKTLNGHGNGTTKHGRSKSEDEEHSDTDRSSESSLTETSEEENIV